MSLDRQECHADGISAWRWQFEPQPRALTCEKFVRDLNEDAGAIARFRIATAGAAVRQADQDLDSLPDYVTALMTANAGDKTHPAGVVLVGRMVQPLGRRKTARSGGGPWHLLVFSTTYSAKRAASSSYPSRHAVHRKMSRHLLWYNLGTSKVQFRISIGQMKISATYASAKIK